MSNFSIQFVKVKLENTETRLDGSTFLVEFWARANGRMTPVVTKWALHFFLDNL